MDNSERLENININECKELFEYEMTEVILKLKGEFATVFGCGNRYKDAAVDDADLMVSVGVLPAVELEDIKTNYPDVSALKMPAFIPSGVAESDTQLGIVSSCPDTSLDGLTFSLPVVASNAANVQDSKMASIDDKKLKDASLVARACASSITKIGVELPTVESAIPVIPSIGATGQIVLSEGSIENKNIDIPRTGSFSEICPVFSQEHSQIMLKALPDTLFTPRVEFHVDLNYSAPTCSIPILPQSFSAVERAAERKVKSSDSIPTPTPATSVPSVGASVVAASKINRLSEEFSPSIIDAMRKVHTSEFGAVPINMFSFAKKLQKDEISSGMMKTIVVPTIPSVKK